MEIKRQISIYAHFFCIPALLHLGVFEKQTYFHYSAM